MNDAARMQALAQAADTNRFQKAVESLLMEMQAEHLALLKVLGGTKHGDVLKKRYLGYVAQARSLLDAFADSAEQCAMALDGRGGGDVDTFLKNVEAAGAELDDFSPVPLKVVPRTVSSLRAQAGKLSTNMGRLVDTFIMSAGYEKDGIEHRLAHAFVADCLKKNISPGDEKSLEETTGQLAKVAGELHAWYRAAQSAPASA